MSIFSKNSSSIWLLSVKEETGRLVSQKESKQTNTSVGEKTVFGCISDCRVGRQCPLEHKQKVKSLGRGRILWTIGRLTIALIRMKTVSSCGSDVQFSSSFYMGRVVWRPRVFNATGWQFSSTVLTVEDENISGGSPLTWKQQVGGKRRRKQV